MIYEGFQLLKDMNFYEIVYKIPEIRYNFFFLVLKYGEMFLILFLVSIFLCKSLEELAKLVFK